jgi:glycerol-3-phosphate dehydrogenase
MKDDTDNQILLSNEPPLTVAEVLYGIREEMAFHLTDMVLRRTELGSCGYPGESVLHGVAKVMARELCWSQKQCQQEMNAMTEIYKKMHVRLP